MIKHIVSFKLKGSDAQRREAAQAFRDALLALPSVIDCLESMEVGINENPAEDWDIVLTATIDKMENVAVYATHPAHVAAAAIIAPVKDARACIDYSV